MQYRPVHADDHGGGVATQSFELESAQMKSQADRSNKRYLYGCMSFCLLLAVVVVYGTYRGGGDQSSPEFPINGGDDWSKDEHNVDTDEEWEEDKKDLDYADKTPPSGNQSGKPRFIFCYGDSLTFGISPPAKDPYPYAPRLEKELNHLYDPDKSSKIPPTIVQHFGLPGWTANMMLDHISDENTGVCSIVRRIPNLEVVIILVGTNDLGKTAGADKDIPGIIVKHIEDLHEQALDCAKDAGNKKLQTLMVGIPGSDYQEHVTQASELASTINDLLKEYATTSSKTTYVDFPFSFEKGGENWAVDGLHLSKDGYDALAEALAPRVKTILDNID